MVVRSPTSGGELAKTFTLCKSPKGTTISLPRDIPRSKGREASIILWRCGGTNSVERITNTSLYCVYTSHPLRNQLEVRPGSGGTLLTLTQVHGTWVLLSGGVTCPQTEGRMWPPSIFHLRGMAVRITLSVTRVLKEPPGRAPHLRIPWPLLGVLSWSRPRPAPCGCGEPQGYSWCSTDRRSPEPRLGAVYFPQPSRGKETSVLAPS